MELLNCNIVARIAATMDTLLRCLSQCCMVDPPQIDQNTMNGMALLNQCLVILSNLAAANHDARNEILKYKMLDLIVRAFQIQLVQNCKTTIGNLAFFMRNVTQKFNAAHLKNVNAGVIVAAMIQMLYAGDDTLERMVIQTFVQLSDSSKARFADTVLKYEQTCYIGIGERSYWQWICEHTQQLMQIVPPTPQI